MQIVSKVQSNKKNLNVETSRLFTKTNENEKAKIYALMYYFIKGKIR